MFFILSKILAYLLKPLPWVLILFVFSAFAKKHVLKKRLFIVAMSLLLFFSNAFIAESVYKSWEVNPVKHSELDSVYEIAIVLGGGMMMYDEKLMDGVFVHNTDRIMQGIKLLKTGRVKKLLISGGPATLFNREHNEARLLFAYFTQIGIDSSSLLMDTVSDNTYENALYAVKLLEKNNIKGKSLLITSAIHMRRARACFSKFDISFDIYPSNHLIANKHIAAYLIPDYKAFERWDAILHELFGYVTYRLMGYV